MDEMIPDDCTSLSEYEQGRVRNIQRNNARLRSLGLISVSEEKQSNALALHPHLKSIATGTDSIQSRKRMQNTFVKGEPARKSRRLQGLSVEGEVEASKESHNQRRKALYYSDEEDNKYISELKRRRTQRVRECREMRQKAAIALAQECGAFDSAAKKNPTATYDHALHRIRSMTEKGLANRIKAIERALGKHCIVKMAIFKSALQDEGLWELADLAAEALERLKGTDWSASRDRDSLVNLFTVNQR